MSVVGIATLWKWNSIFPDRRDFENLVHLPIHLRSLFASNFVAVMALASLYTIIVNAASLILFPGAVFGTEIEVRDVIRFALGHSISVIAASLFAFCAVFALTGIVLALFPFGISRRLSLLVRFAVMVCLLTLLITSFSVPSALEREPLNGSTRLTMLPSVWFLGVARWLWVRGSDPFYAEMAYRACLALVTVFFTGVVSYIVGFRRAFLNLPEMTDIPIQRRPGSVRPGLVPQSILRSLFPNQAQRACASFIMKTLARSEPHQQVLLFFLAVALVVCAKRLSDVPANVAAATSTNAFAEYLSVPFVIAFCVIVGIRCCYEIPLDLRGNWIFKLWIDATSFDARAAAREVLLLLSLSWIVPLTFACSLHFWGFYIALVHTLLVIGSSVVIVEASLVRFRKMPFTCGYPEFESHSPLIVVAYLFGFLLVTNYVPKAEARLYASPWTIAILFVPILATLAGLHQYRRNMLEIDKVLTFEEPKT